VFTDEPVTPTRLETLLDLLRGTRHQFDREKLGLVLQPDELPEVGAESKRAQTRSVIRAATDLGLVDEAGGTLRLTFKAGDERGTREIVLQAIDERVLASTDVEPYFAPFFAWLLGLGAAGEVKRSSHDWSVAFETAAFGGRSEKNPFNATKYDGLHRWMGYAGLGWYDPGEIFQPNPYERLTRRLPAIFAGDRRLTGDEFIRRVGACCPELDGGDIFVRFSPGWRPEARACTPGLSHALVDLHLDGRIVLTCARDSGGWSIAAAEPPSDGRTLQSSRLDFVELA
jgi:hypothetical protein